MHLQPRARLTALAFCAGALAGCSSEHAVPSAPEDRPSPEVVVAADGTGLEGEVVTLPSEGAGEASSLTRKAPLTSVYADTVYVTPRTSGVLELPSAGLTVTVPRGAVRRPMYLWVKALPGSAVAYEFGPHGTTFDVPLQAKQNLKPTGWATLADDSELEVGYFAAAPQVNTVTGDALVNEFLPVDAVSSQGRAEFRIWHFSGYLLSTGRKH
jgi:hypothetical protein